jgi:hypothetical protein
VDLPGRGTLVGLYSIFLSSFFSLLCCTYRSFLLVHAWLMPSVDYIEDNVKPGAKF